MAAHGKPMSRLQRSIDAPHRRLLTKLEEQWNSEEDRALIKNKAAPMARLSRGQSVSRNIMLNRLGADLSVNLEAAKGFARTRTPSFNLGSTSGASDSAWRLPGISLAQDYHQEGQARQRQLRAKGPVRAFPPHPKELTTIELYLESRRAKPKMNPYADVEQALAKKGMHMSEAGFVKTSAIQDPFKNQPYIDQDDAWFVSKRARRLRIKIHSLGISDAAEQADRMKDTITALKNGTNESQAMQAAAEMATTNMKPLVRNGWKQALAQPTVKPSARRGTDAAVNAPVEIAPTARRGATLTQLSSYEALLFGGASLSANGKPVYSNQVFKLRFQPLHWEKVDATGSVPFGRAFHSAILSQGTRVIVFGGIGKLGMNKECYSLDVNTFQWSVVFQSSFEGDLPSSRHGHTLTETDDASTAVMFGGAGAGFFNDVYFLDCFTGRWSTRELSGDAPAPRAFHSACSLERQSRIMIFGGQNGSANLNDLYELNVRESSWTFVRTSGTQPSPRWGHMAFSQGLDNMVIFGGGGEGFFGDMHHFSAYKLSWREVHAPGKTPDGRWGHAGVAVEETARVFLFGGASAAGPYLGDTYQLDTAGPLPPLGPIWGTPTSSTLLVPFPSLLDT
ncbi:hypothetical protein T484DRAFT_1890646 [Baffinella frigidus]|nr:hypothetical protein T484DRAFT_1890646 [Cryptophyta sp. CCMP2293]